MDRNGENGRIPSNLSKKCIFHVVFYKHPFKECTDKQLHVFSDASEKAKATVAFLRAVGQHSKMCWIFLRKSKVAPKHGHTILRLELCASVLAVEVAEM